MSTLYIDHANARLALESTALVVWLGEKRQRSIPLALLERVVCVGNAQLDTRVLVALAEQGIAFSAINARYVERRALLLGSSHQQAQLRLLQYRLVQDPMWRLRISCELMRAKWLGHVQLMDTLLVQRPDQRKVIIAANNQLQHQLEQLAQTSQLSTLLGMEGAAARAVFQALSSVFPASLGFSTRQRRPPPDPVNACLSLAYTLLHKRAVQVIYALGLEPLLGFYHEVSFGRESLASDLIEVWRPVMDEWVWALFRDQTLPVQHFKFEQGSCYLDKGGRQIFFAALEVRLKSVTRALRWQVRALIKHMQEQGEHHA